MYQCEDIHVDVTMTELLSVHVESSYGSDSEDSDWAPDEGRPKTGGDDDSEDVADLVADAEEFLKNKKMTRPV